MSFHIPVIAVVAIFAVAIVVAYLGFKPKLDHLRARSAAFDTVEEGIILVDEDLSLVEYNEAAAGMFPQLAGTDEGALQDIVPELWTGTPTMMAAVEDINSRVSTVDEDGERVRLVETHALDANATGQAGHIVVIRDVTDIERQRRDLKRQTEQLDQFASIVSHDLRNPLQVAMSFVTAEYRNTGNDKLERASNALKRMEQIIDDALTLSREGRAIEEFFPTVLESAVRQAWRTSDSKAATLQTTDISDITLYADDSRLQTLLENLFRNSVDHGPDDVTIRVGPIESQPDGAVAGEAEVVGFYVEDTGPGIPPEERADAVEQGYTTADDGTGFGLAIVASIAAAHGWQMGIGESPEGGARFEFRDVTVASAD